MHDIAQKQIFFKNYQSWIRIWQKGPDPTGSGSATLLVRDHKYLIIRAELYVIVCHNRIIWA
jgi:hypothetical protein